MTDQLGDQVRRAVEMLVQTLDRIDKDSQRALLHRHRRDRTLRGGADRDDAAGLPALRGGARVAAARRAALRPALRRLDPAQPTARAGRPAGRGSAGAAQRCLEPPAGHSSASSTAASSYDDLRLPAYGGDLFDPDRFPFLEGRAAGHVLAETPAAPLPIDNRTVLHLLERCNCCRCKVPGGGAEPRRLSFRALDIEQIGHVYEGLLDHTARRATDADAGPDWAQATASRRSPLAELEALAGEGRQALLDFLKEQTGRSAATRCKRDLRRRPDEAEAAQPPAGGLRQRRSTSCSACCPSRACCAATPSATPW